VKGQLTEKLAVLIENFFQKARAVNVIVTEEKAGAMAFDNMDEMKIFLFSNLAVVGYGPSKLCVSKMVAIFADDSKPRNSCPAS